MLTGLVAMGLVASYGSPNPPAAFGGLCLAALASLMAGGLLGMLFGLPRWVKPAADGTSKEYRSFDPNDNLVQVSDWLTKIIVGITLTQFDNLGHRLYYVAALVGSYLKFADAPSSGIGVGYGVIIGFSGTRRSGWNGTCGYWY